MASVASRISRASSSGRSVRGDDARILHEGWTEHFSSNYKNWYRYWTVLNDTELLCFSVVMPSGRRQLSGKISIGHGTAINNSSEKFGFELTTSSAIGQQKELFRFKNENDRDLWKAYIIGLTTGNVPSDVNLLPGQLRDVLHAVRNIPAPVLPPPHPAPPRPNTELPPVPPPSAAATGDCDSEPPVDYNEDDDGNVRAYAMGDGRVSVRLYYDASSRSRSDVDDNVNVAEGAISADASSNGLQQLLTRQSNLAFRTLNEERRPRRGHMLSLFVQQTWTPPQPPQPGGVQRSRSYTAGTSALQSGSASVRFFVDEQTWKRRFLPEAQTTRITARDSNSTANNNNSETHPFYMDPLKNRFPPNWFVECDRETAESVLLASRNHGNVLMRPSASGAQMASYGITMRCDEPSGSRILHYAVHRTSVGFRIAVDNPQQPPMSCLSDVMNFFVEVVGRSARPLTAVRGLDNARSSATSMPSSMSSAATPSNVETEIANGSDTTTADVSVAVVDMQANVVEDVQRLDRLHLHDSPPPVTTSAATSASATSDQVSSPLPPSTGLKSWPTSIRPPVAGNSRLSTPSTTSASGRQRLVFNSTVSGPRSPYNMS